ncbi:MAG: tRNA pseudouridine(38-40) synthase TruA [Bacteroidia bacterium]
MLFFTFAPHFSKLQRYFLEIKFRGTSYHGWQVQENAHSVQAELNKALGTLLKQEVQTTGCGRTDTDVHALQFYVHFETDNLPERAEQFAYRLNAILPWDIAVKKIIDVHPEAHSRFDATSRTYEYKIVKTKEPFLKELAHFEPVDFDMEPMNEAAKELLNYDDFKAFSKGEVEFGTTLCKITEAHWRKENDLFIFKISANRFLRNMVRAIVGTLLEVGKKRMTIKEFQNVIAKGERAAAGVSVPGYGLYLISVIYPYIND